MPVSYDSIGYGAAANPAAVTGVIYRAVSGGPINLAPGATYVHNFSGMVLWSLLPALVSFEFCPDGVTWWISFVGDGITFTPPMVAVATWTRILNGSANPVSLYFAGWGII